MSLTLYSIIGSIAAARAALRALGLEDKVKIDVNPSQLEHLKLEFDQKNSTTIPVLEDKNLIRWLSDAIYAYLVDKYGKNDSLYPKDPRKRALVDSMNNFNTRLFARGAKLIRAALTLGTSANLEELKKGLLESLDMLEQILKKSCYVAGDKMTIADFSIAATLFAIEVFLPIGKEKYANIIKWLRKMKQLLYHNINERGLKAFSSYFNYPLSKL